MRKPALAAIAALVGTMMMTSASLAQTTAMCAGLTDAASWAADREAVTEEPQGDLRNGRPARAGSHCSTG